MIVDDVRVPHAGGQRSLRSGIARAPSGFAARSAASNLIATGFPSATRDALVDGAHRAEPSRRPISYRRDAFQAERRRARSPPKKPRPLRPGCRLPSRLYPVPRRRVTGGEPPGPSNRIRNHSSAPLTTHRVSPLLAIPGPSRSDLFARSGCLLSRKSPDTARTVHAFSRPHRRRAGPGEAWGPSRRAKGRRSRARASDIQNGYS